MRFMQKSAITKMQAIIISVVIIVAAIVGGYVILNPPAAAEPIKIGFVAPLTGAAASGGLRCVYGAQFAVDEWNRKGGVLGREVELVLGDSEGNPERGRAVMLRLIEQDNVVAVAGEFLSLVGTVLADVADTKELPLVIASCSANSITERDSPWVFRVCANATGVSISDAKFIAEFLAPSTWAYVGDESDYGRVLLEQLVEKVPVYSPGTELVFEEYAPLETTDFYPVLTRALAENPDLLLFSVSGVGGPLMVKQTRELGYDGPIMQTMGSFDEFKEVAGEAAEAVVFHWHVANAPMSSETLPWIARFEQNPPQGDWGSVPADHKPYTSHFEMRSYDSVYSILLAIEKAGSVEPDAIRQELVKTSYVGPRGVVEFGSLRQAKLGYPYEASMMAQDQEGEIVIIWPEESATGDYITYSGG